MSETEADLRETLRVLTEAHSAMSRPYPVVTLGLRAARQALELLAERDALRGLLRTWRERAPATEWYGQLWRDTNKALGIGEG